MTNETFGYAAIMLAAGIGIPILATFNAALGLRLGKPGGRRRGAVRDRLLGFADRHSADGPGRARPDCRAPAAALPRRTSRRLLCPVDHLGGPNLRRRECGILRLARPIAQRSNHRPFRPDGCAPAAPDADACLGNCSDGVWCSADTARLTHVGRPVNLALRSRRTR